MPDASEQNPVTSVRTGYDRWSAIYDHDLNPLVALEDPVMRAAAGNVAGVDALDIGCGTGRHALWLAAAGAKVVAVDFSERMLAEARNKPGAESIKFIPHDLHQPLPFADRTFDLAVSGLVVEHIRDLVPFLSEAHRVLRPNGRFLVSAMHPAMFLRGSQAAFTDPDSGEKIRVGSIAHRFSHMVMSAVRSGFEIDDIQEHAPDAPFSIQYPRAEKYVDWPMLLVMQLSKRH